MLARDAEAVFVVIVAEHAFVMFEQDREPHLKGRVRKDLPGFQIVAHLVKEPGPAIGAASDHHAIGLKPGKAKARPQGDEALKMEHLALEVDNVDVLFKTRDFLQANDIPVVFEGRKGAGGNICVHFQDPDGYEFELYCGMDQVGEGGRARPAEQFKRVKTLEDAVANPLEKSW